MPYLKRVVSCPEPIDCKILTAALDLFVENGYHNVSIHEIQKRADVSIGSIYNHFGGKEGVATALYKHLINEVDELVEDVVNKAATPGEQCAEIISQLFRYTDTHGNIMAFIFHAKHNEFLTDEPLIYNTSPFTKIQHIVEEGIQAGEFVELDSCVVASSLFGGAIRLIQLRLDGLIDQPLIHYHEAVISAWSGLILSADAVADKMIEKTSITQPG